MKKLILMVVAVAAMATTSAFAQLQFGAKVGANLSNFAVSEGDGPDMKIGFNLGATVDFGFTDELFLFSGLELTQKGAKESFDYGEKVTVKYRPLYLQIPIHIAYKFDLGSVKIVPEAGPFLAIGIAGKIVSDAKDSDSVNFFDKEEGFTDKRFDLGIGAGVGVEFGQFGVKLGYDYGLMNIIDDDDVSIKNTNLYLSVGYKF